MNMNRKTSPTNSIERKAGRLRNTDAHWGLTAAALHWGMAISIIGLFALGLWMTSLSYYNPWYKQGPDLHRAIGILLFLTMLARLVWRFIDRAPDPVDGHKAWERKAAHAAHLILYTGLFIVMFSGYLISTADGRAISVFGLFDVPATITSIEKQEDVAGFIHFWLAVALISTAAGHALAALKHHFIDKDNTLKRMFARA